jgi:hypothetical protein
VSTVMLAYLVSAFLSSNSKLIRAFSSASSITKRQK